MKLMDLVDDVANEAGLQKGAAKKAIDAVFAGILEAAKKAGGGQPAWVLQV